jgi:hypothetical protein
MRGHLFYLKILNTNMNCIVVEDDASSHWSLQHSGDSFTSMTDHDVETHTWNLFNLSK